MQVICIHERWLSIQSYFNIAFVPQMFEQRHNSIEMMKYILRDRGGLKCTETKHAGRRLATQAGWLASFNHGAALINRHTCFIFILLTSCLAPE